MSKIDAFLEQVCRQVKAKEAHKGIRLELETHIQEIVQEYQETGVGEEEAINHALLHMGDPRLIGKQLHTVYNPKTEWSIIACLCLFISIGLLTMYFTPVNDLGRPLDTDSVSALFYKQIMIVLFGSILLTGLYFFDYRKLLPFAYRLYWSTLVLMLVVKVYGAEAKGEKFLSIGGIAFDFMSITPVILLIALAGIMASWKWEQPLANVKLLGLFFLPSLVYLVNGHNSIVLFYFIVSLVLLFTLKITRHRKQKLVFTYLIASISLVASVLLHLGENMLQRYLSFVNPYADPLNTGYQYVQSLELLKSAGWWGQGFDNTALGRLPALHSDFIFTYLIHSLGWFLGLIMIMTIAIFIWRMMIAANKVSEPFGRLLIISLSAFITVQFVWNIGMGLAFLPIISVTLPFISSGGLHVTLNMLVVGIILSVYRRKDLARLQHNRNHNNLNLM